MSYSSQYLVLQPFGVLKIIKKKIINNIIFVVSRKHEINSDNKNLDQIKISWQITPIFHSLISKKKIIVGNLKKMLYNFHVLNIFCTF